MLLQKRRASQTGWEKRKEGHLVNGNVKQGCDRAAPASQRVLAGGRGAQAGRGLRPTASREREVRKVGRRLSYGNKDSSSRSAPGPHTSLPRRRQALLLTRAKRAPRALLAVRSLSQRGRDHLETCKQSPTRGSTTFPPPLRFRLLPDVHRRERKFRLPHASSGSCPQLSVF